MELISRSNAAAAGLRNYFTGEPCKHGHVAEREVSSRTCRECIRLKSRAYMARRRESDPLFKKMALARIKAWKEANPEKAKKADLRWKAENRETEREKGKLRQRQRRADNPDLARDQARRWRQSNPQKQREYDRRKRERNPEGRAALLIKLMANPAYVKAASANKRARKQVGGGRVTAAELRTIRDRAKGRCANCGQRRKLEYDHIVPIARGGGHDPKNLQMLCRPCNMEKLARDPIEWAQANGRLL